MVYIVRTFIFGGLVFWELPCPRELSMLNIFKEKIINDSKCKVAASFSPLVFRASNNHAFLEAVFM